MIDFTDPTYGGRIRQIYNPEGDEHDLYHYRSVFNADNSRMLGIETPSGSTDYQVTLYDGDGRFLKRLFTQAEYDWRAAWDRREPRFFYTWTGSTVYRFDAEPGKPKALKTFENPSLASPSGLSLNQQGDRLLLRMADKSAFNYHLTWPAGVRGWFLLSFFPQTGRLPERYEPWLDELVQVFVDGRHRVLARTGTTCGANFWAQPQPSPSADGTRVLFHSNGTCTVGEIGCESSGTIDQCILYLK